METKSSTVPSKPDSSLAKARLEEAILAKGAAREMMARHRESRFMASKENKFQPTKFMVHSNPRLVKKKSTFSWMKLANRLDLECFCDEKIIHPVLVLS